MEIGEAIEEMKKIRVKRVFVQLPEGLKTKSLEIADLLEKNGLDVVICIENTYGACDLRDEEALRLGCDAILHLGHNDFGFEKMKSNLPIFYIELFSERDGRDGYQMMLDVLKNFKKIGVVYSIQYKMAFENVVKFLRENEKEVFYDKNGQIIGCNLLSALNVENKVDAFLVVSSGNFHAFGLALKTQKPVFVFDAELGEIRKIEIKKYLKILEWNKKIFEESRKVGLLVSWKKGQIKDFKSIKDRIEKLGKKVYVLSFDELNENLLEGLKLDCLVNLACPRICVEDAGRYKMPIVCFNVLLQTEKF